MKNYRYLRGAKNADQTVYHRTPLLFIDTIAI